MYHMKKASVRDLRYKFHEVEDLLRSGQEVEITKRKRPIARLVPIRKKRRKLPDFYARMRKIFGKRKMAVSNAELLAWDREE
jgi:prevent-host-death family protein